MMARLLDEAAPARGHSAPTTPLGGGQFFQEANKQPARKLSFKTRQTASRSNFRAAKVSLSSTNVALLASKFNTIVIEDGAQSRALLRKLSNSQRKPSVNKEVKRPVKQRGEGVVKAAIEIFEHQDLSNSKLTLKKGNDSRSKLVVVRKSSSKHSVKLEDHSKPPDLKKPTPSTESAKDRVDLKNIEMRGTTTTNTEIKEVRRKPSLKAKPVLKHTNNRQEPATSLIQRIARFNSNENVCDKAKETILNREVRQPKFDLNERIAQFSRTESRKTLASEEEKDILKVSKINEENRKTVTFEVEEKENKQEVTKSILRNGKNKQMSLVEQTKNRLASIIQQNNNCNQQIRPKSVVKSETKDSPSKDKLISGEKKEFKVFQSMPDIVRSVEGKDDVGNKRLSVPRDATILENVFVNYNHKTVNSVDQFSGSNSDSPTQTNATISSDQSDCKTIVQSVEETDSQASKTLASKHLKGAIKPSIKPITSESPKIEKKNLFVAPDPVDSIQLDKIKPNNSFLWKPSSKISVVTEVPIYDDRPESRNSDRVFEDDSYKFEPNDTGCMVIENEAINANSLDLDIASSFILEMTEQIDRRFSSGSAQENDFEDSDCTPSLNETNENVIKNSSFLHGKNKSNGDNEVSQQNKCFVHSVNYKSHSSKSFTLPLPANTSSPDIPPKLPEKKAKMTKELNDACSPPIPPSHTKPKVTRTPSEEAWLNNCKKILEIPPPLRSREGSRDELFSESQSNKIITSEQYRSPSEKRFSVSQIELLRRMSEMNLSNKRNSLPTDSCSVANSYIDPEEDHYSSIQNGEKNDVDDQDAYESIGENNYAEIEDGDALETRREKEVDATSNIYDDVGELEGEEEGEDHYEAINCPLVAAQDSDSSCDQSNSLYGLTRPASQGGGGYQAGLAGGSDTSDEWVDLDNSDEQQESVFIFREKDRRGAETWSMKVRRQWSRQAADGDVKVSSSSILYIGNSDEPCISKSIEPAPTGTKGLVSVRTSVQLCGSYDAQEVVAYLGNEDGSDESVPRSYENIEVNDETAYCDDFDDSFSDSSFDQETINPNIQKHTMVMESVRRCHMIEVICGPSGCKWWSSKQVQPDGPHITSIMLLLDVEEKRPAPLSEGIYGLMKQAGQRMRKHWSLGKSLTRMRKNKSTSTAQTTANLGRRGWSFKSREKPLTTQSTFYLHSNTLTRTESKTETKVDPRRLSTTSMLARPTSPPPPPPRNSVDETSRRKSLLNSSNSSSGDNEGYIEGQRRLSRNGNGNSMWYIETSTDTASEHGSSQGSDLNLRFADEPLYQFYAENIAKMTLSEWSDRDSEGYEEISPGLTSSIPSALDLVSSCQHRSLWCEVPQVRNSGVLDTLSQSRKRLQEAKFEVMISEASYFKSLTVLDKVFASCPLFCDENILTRDDRKTLFGNVGHVRKCSEKLLTAMQSCWQECILLQGMSDAVYDHIRSERQVYIKYCTNQISMDRTLKRLKQNNSNFSTVLAQLESEPQCQALTLYSFLMLPMQRITRLRLLFDTILSLLEPSDSEHAAVQRTLDALNKCVSECNEGARSQERHEEMVKLSKQLDFPSEMTVPILEPGSGRWLVRSGPMVQVNLDAKQTFSRRLSRSGPKLTFFLFTDLLLVTKKKSEESYQVLDHCQRSLLETREIRDFPGYSRCLLGLTLLENAEKKTVEMTVSCESDPEHQRWLQVLSPPQSDQPGETLYEGWDCPQVTVTHAYMPQQPDELALALGDVVNVLRKTEGWFYGERTRDGEKGWFPGSYSREIASKHVRARNLKQRHRLLQLSADFVQQQKKVKS